MKHIALRARGTGRWQPAQGVTDHHRTAVVVEKPGSRLRVCTTSCPLTLWISPVKGDANCHPESEEHFRTEPPQYPCHSGSLPADVSEKYNTYLCYRRLNSSVVWPSAAGIGGYDHPKGGYKPRFWNARDRRASLDSFSLGRARHGEKAMTRSSENLSLISWAGTAAPPPWRRRPIPQSRQSSCWAMWAPSHPGDRHPDVSK